MFEQGWEMLRMQLLRFAPFSDAELELLKPHVTALSLKKGQTLAEEGGIAKLVGIVVSGNMRRLLPA